MITKITKAELKAKSRYHQPCADIKQFLSTAWEACMVDITGYRTLETARSSYHRAARELNVRQAVMVCRRENNLYLVRKEL